MEKLIEFLIKNIYIVIVVGGFVLSAISKMKSSNNRQPRQMPPFGGGERPSVPSPVYGTPESMPSSERKAWEVEEEDEEDEEEESPYAASKASPVEQRQMRPVVHSVSAASRPQRQSQHAADNRPSSTAASNTANHPSPELSAAALKQAVIWSEVLGPPRAKRPYRIK